MAERLLILACGALAREIQHLVRLNGWTHVQMECLSASLHNTPDLIVDELRLRLADADNYDRVLLGYADCGTGGAIDRLIAADDRLERLPGAHCYAFFAGIDRFDEIADAAPGTFYLTDYLVRHFDALVVKPLQLDEHPELHQMLFGNYERALYLSQLPDDELFAAAQAAADRLGLRFEHLQTGFGELESGIDMFAGIKVVTA